MIQLYKIEGMTCEGCVAKVRSNLEKIAGVNEVKVQLNFPQGEINMSRIISLGELQEAIGRYKIYTIKQPTDTQVEVKNFPDKSLSTYRPLILIVSFIVGITLLIQYPYENFSWLLWMRHFMAGFFLVFAFFKLLNIKGFALSYQMYDIVAARWKGWGYIYPFVELGLGILYLINIAPILTNWITLIVLGISSIGVIRSVLDKRKIKCACLGDVFNLPMSTVTIVEDLTMAAMAGGMLLFV